MRLSNFCTATARDASVTIARVVDGHMLSFITVLDAMFRQCLAEGWDTRFEAGRRSTH